MYIADFHIHSRYSRATSKNMELDELARWAAYKGINLLGSADFTHFLWYHELKEKLVETDREGIYSYKGIDFILTTEVSHIYEKHGRTKKVHNLIFLSSVENAGRFNRILERYADLNSDGRPILTVDAKEIVKLVFDADEKGFVVPAHIWTPHFSVFGSNSGFDAIEECFEDMTNEIFALETGLSSDPAMNWMVSALDRFSLISNSDAHSPWKIGREANVFDAPFSFDELRSILKYRNSKRFLYTVEYFPEEGKYHFDGHRNCNICFSPEESLEKGNLCPVCGRKLTVGVLHRVKELSDRNYGEKHRYSIPFKKIIPLSQIIGFSMNKSADSISVRNRLIEILNVAGNEFSVLIETPLKELAGRMDENTLNLLSSMRKGEVEIKPGYDGEFGKIEISVESDKSSDTQSLF
ncbi:MAG TPA: endonuclease Q family protein [bacterium]|nr:endonuclease Q family protein [bacterium]